MWPAFYLLILLCPSGYLRLLSSYKERHKSISFTEKGSYKYYPQHLFTPSSQVEPWVRTGGLHHHLQALREPLTLFGALLWVGHEHYTFVANLSLFCDPQIHVHLLGLYKKKIQPNQVNHLISDEWPNRDVRPRSCSF